MTEMEKVIKGLEVCTSIEDGESCPKECPYYHSWDLSIDDYTNVCDKLHIQVDDCDAYGPFYVPILCPLEKKEDKV